MSSKAFTVVTLPKDDQGNLIEINKRDFYTTWSDACEAYRTIVEHLGGGDVKTPKTSQPLSAETPTEIVQIWVCYLPLIINH